MPGTLAFGSRTTPERFTVNPFLKIMDYFYIIPAYTHILDISDI